MVHFPVMKFGGASLADGAAVRRVCAVVAQCANQRPAVVVSAHAGVTALLEREARAAAAGKARGDEVRVRHHTLLSQLGLASPRQLLRLELLREQVCHTLDPAFAQAVQGFREGLKLSHLLRRPR